jgi:phage tail-like protein
MGACTFDEVLENGAGKFQLDIPGASVASKNVESVTIEDLVIDEREGTCGANWDYRMYGPGDAHFGSVTIRARVGKDSKELYQWWLDCSQGKNIRKNVSVISLKRDGSPARRWELAEVFPVRWDAGEYSPSSTVACETIVGRCQRISLA